MATDLYVKKDWQTGETITEAALDNLEKGVSDAFLIELVRDLLHQS